MSKSKREVPSLPNEDAIKKRLIGLNKIADKAMKHPSQLAYFIPILNLYDEIYQNTSGDGVTRTEKAKDKLRSYLKGTKGLTPKMSTEQKDLLMLLIDLRDDFKKLFKAEVITKGLNQSGFGIDTKGKLTGQDELVELISRMQKEDFKLTEAADDAITVLTVFAKDDERRSPDFSPDSFTLQLLTRGFKLPDLSEDEEHKNVSDKLEVRDSETRANIFLATLGEALKGYTKLLEAKKIKDPLVKSTGNPKPFSERVDEILKTDGMKSKNRMEAIKEAFVEAKSKLGKIDNIHAQRLNRFIGLINKTLGTKLPYYRSEKAKEIKRHMQGIFAKADVQTAAEKKKAEKAAEKRDEKVNKHISKHGI